jgi:hypothetical protein
LYEFPAKQLVRNLCQARNIINGVNLFPYGTTEPEIKKRGRGESMKM